MKAFFTLVLFVGLLYCFTDYIHSRPFWSGTNGHIVDIVSVCLAIGVAALASLGFLQLIDVKEE
ncbi:hypothetical protein [Tellurirhabdus bombi]|uniref:hypothetical protein n=1 Tax=Tellurirhabdus bombi TaxID=2907205 RepID=UPI001F237E64|nr:hypothetical protein [Tellurirhabdus bombi]